MVLTSNATRELSEAIKRRCLFLHIDYPEAEREREIVVSQVPEVEEGLAGQDGRDRREAARTGAAQGALHRGDDRLGTHAGGARHRHLDAEAMDQTLGVVLKHASDHERAVRELRLRSK